MKDIKGFCPQCGRFIEQKSLPFCNNCFQKYHEDLVKIKKCLKEYPDANAIMVANYTGLPIERILLYIKTGALTLKAQDEM